MLGWLAQFFTKYIYLTFYIHIVDHILYLVAHCPFASFFYFQVLTLKSVLLNLMERKSNYRYGKFSFCFVFTMNVVIMSPSSFVTWWIVLSSLLTIDEIYVLPKVVCAIAIWDSQWFVLLDLGRWTVKNVSFLIMYSNFGLGLWFSNIYRKH